MRPLLVLSTLAATVVAQNEYGCFSQIPGLTFKASSQFQSRGACKTSCGDAAVFALQGSNCYCGSEVPAPEMGSNACSQTCPGWQPDMCGGPNAYNVYLLGGPFSTASGSSSSASSGTGGSSSSSLQSTSSDVPSSSATDAATSSGSSSTTASSQLTSPSSSGPPPSSTSSSSQSTPSSSSSSGTSSAPTSSSASQSSASPSESQTNEAKKGGGGLSGGAIGGIVVGVIVGVAALVALSFFLWRQRQSSGEDDDDEYYSPESSPNKFKEGFGVPPPAPAAGANNSFHSNYNMSYPPVVDQRLNPGMLNHRISIASLNDARDYSRQILHIANPDR